MSAQIIISGITFAQTPAINVFGTLKFKKASDSNYTIKSEAVEVNTDGTFVDDVVLDALDENTTYDVYFKNNAGGAAKVKQFTTPDSNLTYVTVSNELTGTTITQIKIDGGSNLLANPIPAGHLYLIPMTLLTGGSKAIKLTFGVAPGAKMFNDVRLGVGGLLGGAYFDSAADYVTFTRTWAVDDNLYVRTADRHLRPDLYQPVEGAITGICHFNAAKVTRSQIATDDATYTAQDVDVVVRWNSDNNASTDKTTTFTSTDTEKTTGGDTDDGGSCSTVVGSIVTVSLTPAP